VVERTGFENRQRDLSLSGVRISPSPLVRVPGDWPGRLARWAHQRPCRLSSVVEQRFCKARVGGSNPLGGCFPDNGWGERPSAGLRRYRRCDRARRGVFAGEVKAAFVPDRRGEYISSTPKGGPGSVPEWPNGADCKSVGLCLRGFESLRSHFRRRSQPRSAVVFLGVRARRRGQSSRHRTSRPVGGGRRPPRPRSPLTRPGAARRPPPAG
jgi:hypothetical protein